MNQSIAVVSRQRIVFATSFGNFLEFFDFTVFTSFIVIISAVFFPAADPTTALMKSLAVFGAGFFMRPIGGMVLGYYADRCGRKSAMILTLALMTLATLTIACAPGAETAGIWGAVILVCARLVQGLAAGGDVGASTAMLVESAPHDRRGFYSSWQLATQGASTMCGGLLAWGLSGSLSQEEMMAWGWRVPFFIGAALGPIGLYLQLQIQSEAGNGAAPLKRADTPQTTLATLTLLRQHLKEILVGILLTIGGTITVYLSYYYYATMAGRFLGIPQSYTGAAIGLSGFLALMLSPVAGYLSDIYGRKPMVLYSRLVMLVLAVPSYWLLARYPSPAVLFLTVAVMASLTTLGAAPSILIVSETFPRAIRALGFAIVYSVGVALFGGYAQFFATGLIGWTGSLLSPAIYLSAGCLAALVALCFVKDQYRSELK